MGAKPPADKGRGKKVRARPESAGVSAGEALLGHVLNALPQAVFWKDRNGVYLGCNEAFARTVGLGSPDEVVGKTDLDLPWPRKEAEAYRADDQDVIERDQPKRGIIEPLQRADGTRGWVKTTKVPLADASGRVYGVLGIYDDVTAGKQAEDALRRSEEKFLKVFQASPAPTCISRLRDGCFLDVNGAMEKMIGYGRDELLGRTSIELGIWVDPEDRDRLLCALAEQGSVRDWECRFRAKGGHVLVARYFVELMELGGELCLLSLFVDETEKKRTLEELRRSEHEFRAMFDLSGVGMAQADPVTGQFVRVNRKFCEILGYSERELLGMTYAEITHPEDRESSIRSVQAVTKGEAGTWFVEKRYVRKGGEAIWVTAHGTALRDAEGRPIRAMAVVQDITERKLAEVALRESRQMLQAVLDTIPVRVFWKDRNSVFLGCNRLFAQDADLASPADIVGKVDGDLPWKAQAQSYVADDQAVMKTGQAKLNYEEAQTTAEGKQTWLRTSKIPMKDADGHSIGVLATYEDVTERKQAEEEIRRLNAELEQRVVDRTSELAAARARLEHLLTGTPAVIYSCDASGHFAATYVSPNVKVLLGYDASEYTTDWRFWSDHLHPDDAPGVLAMIPQLMQQGSLVCEYRFRHKDGTYRWMRDELRLAYGGAASARQIFGCWIDITARKEAEERLLTANATLERRGAELRALAAKLTQAEQQERRRVAHVLHEELQQILVVAKLAIGVIRPAVSGELLEAAVRSSGAIDQAIQVSRSLTTQLRPPVLYELGVVAALNWLARQMKEKYGLEVEVVARAEAEPASDDIRIFVFEAARELLFNVVKHAGVKDARLEIARQNGHVRLTVADDGAGFDPAKSGSSAESPGGYGLFSIRERAEALGGELTVDSAPGRGAVVTVLAPMQ